MRQPPLELIVDRYELTMAESYLVQGMADDRVAFELYARRLPRDRGYLVAAGLEPALDYLRALRFSPESLRYMRESGICSRRLCRRLADERFDGDVDAMAEGTVVLPGEPILRVEGRRLMAQIVETYLLSLVNFQTLIATKATRVTGAAAGRPVVDFGLRRAHGGEAGVSAARAAYIGGVEATATVAAGYLWGIPTTGTMAHSYVLGFADEAEAFACFLKTHPAEPSLLVDTYDVVSGTRHAIEAAERTGIRPRAVRIDSGDVAALARRVRPLLDEAGYPDTQIIVSGDLTETIIEDLVGSGAPIDGFGVGTDLVTSADAPALSGVYKLVESNGRPVMKRAGAKATLPGRHQVFRSETGDTLALCDEQLPGRPLLQPVMRGGEPLGPAPPLAEARRRAAREVAALPEPARALRDPLVLQPALSPGLSALKEALDVPA